MISFAQARPFAVGISVREVSWDTMEIYEPHDIHRHVSVDYVSHGARRCSARDAEFLKWSTQPPAWLVPETDPTVF